MTNNQIIVLYIAGCAACFYLGMRISWWRYVKRESHDVNRAFNRGYKYGRGFIDQVSDARLDMKSAVKILEGGPIEREEWLKRGT